MLFEKEHIYHIFNQGNNREKIFFNHENYLLFLRKMEKYILPYADILAWCLMPNHFHIMVYITKDSLSQREAIFTKTETKDSLTQRETIFTDHKERTFNNSIGYLIRSYTQAVNKSENRTGSLFKAHTKAECVTKCEGIS